MGTLGSTAHSFLAEMVKEPAKFDCLKHPEVLQLEALTFTPFHLFALLLFILAIIHTLCVYQVQSFAKSLEKKRKHLKQGRSLVVHILYLLSEIEVVFAFWAVPLFIVMSFLYGWEIALDYINTRDYTEALFIVVILYMASTGPIVHAAEALIKWVAKGLGGSLSAWWFTLLSVGPLLGSLITEAGAMALCALLLARQFYQYNPSCRLAYATIALLFVNVSIGGVLTDFASPPVLILAHAWHWTALDTFLTFGWKAALGILLANSVYWAYFRKELSLLNVRKKARALLISHTSRPEPPTPFWVTLVHMIFMAWIVIVAHYPALFIAGFLLFLVFYQATKTYQNNTSFARPLLVGLFLAGLVIHAGLQGWWVVEVLSGLTPLQVMGMAMALTGFNDNTAIAYLSTLVPSWGAAYEYAVFTGVVAGGGLTVIANAPNPAGYSILKKYFEHGIRPLKLLGAAIIPTMILYLIFYLFGPLF
jgi:hypothetical protein